jgi:hypothetical protein
MSFVVLAVPEIFTMPLGRIRPALNHLQAAPLATSMAYGRHQGSDTKNW